MITEFEIHKGSNKMFVDTDNEGLKIFNLSKFNPPVFYPGLILFVVKDNSGSLVISAKDNPLFDEIEEIIKNYYSPKGKEETKSKKSKKAAKKEEEETWTITGPNNEIEAEFKYDGKDFKPTTITIPIEDYDKLQKEAKETNSTIIAKDWVLLMKELSISGVFSKQGYTVLRTEDYDKLVKDSEELKKLHGQIVLTKERYAQLQEFEKTVKLSDQIITNSRKYNRIVELHKKYICGDNQRPGLIHYDNLLNFVSDVSNIIDEKC